MKMPKKTLDKLSFTDINILHRWTNEKIIANTQKTIKTIENSQFKKLSTSTIIELLEADKLSLAIDVSLFVEKKESEK